MTKGHRKWNPLSALPEGNPDLLFNADGSVRLPMLAGIAIKMAAESHGCLTRQPTRERAEAVMTALDAGVTARGFTMEIRPGKVSDTFGVYLVSAAEAASV